MAAALKAEEKLNDITDCPICLETYKEPKILPCIHTFCMHCLRKTGEKQNKNSGDTMPCPVCRKEFTVPETGFGGLQKNFFMDKLTEIKNILQPTSARNLCDVCREDKESLVEADIPSAEMYCIECHQKLCSECYKHHRKQKLTKNHKFIATGGQHNFESENMQEMLKTDSCENHLNSMLEIYCSGCQEVVCAICFVENHKSHDGSDINKVATDFRKQIQINVDEFSWFLPQLRQEDQGLDKYKAELMRCTEDIETKINNRRQELKDMVDKHADSLLLELDSIRQENRKKCELNKENIETLLVCLESYKAYYLQLTTVGSASDICRAKTALDARTKELKHLHVSSGNSSYQLSHVSLRITELQDGLRSPDQNIVGELEEHQDQNSGRTKDDYYGRSPVAKVDNLDAWNLDMEKSTKNTSQQDINRATPIQEDEEDNEEFLECMEWNLDACVVTVSIELECLSELEIIVKRKLKEVTTDDSSLHNKLKEVKQRMTSMSENIKTLNAELEIERVHLKEVEQERNVLVDRNNELKSNEDKLSQRVEDLKSQVALLRNLAYSGGKHANKAKGGITCDEGVTFSTTLERLSKFSRDYEVFGIAILESELFVLRNDNVTVIYDLPTLKFKRRWKAPREGKYRYDDIKQCNVNRCLYMMKVESQKQKPNEIIRVDPNGGEITAWSVEKARGQLSVTNESNILLTVSSLNELHEYAPDGKLVQVISVPWNSGIEKPSHAIKLTSDHFLICHGGITDILKRVCIMESTGNVLKYFRGQLSNPVYLDIDGVGNVLVVDRFDRRVILLSSNLKFKRNLITDESHPKEAGTTESDPRKVCFDKANGRVFMVEHVEKHNSNGAIILDSDTVSVFKI